MEFSSPRFWFSLPQLPVEGDQDTSKKPLRNQASNLISSFSHMSKFNIKNYLFCIWGFPDNSVGKESACREGDLGFIPGLGRSSGEGNSYPLQYSGLKNSMDCTVHGITESDTTERLSSFHILHFTRKHCSKVILYLISACIVKKKKNSPYEFCTVFDAKCTLKCFLHPSPFQDKKSIRT